MESRRILGVNFYAGDVRGAIERISRGGLLVVPAAPALKTIDSNVPYREALINSDVALPDSALMVMVWNRLQADKVKRLSGLEYLKELLLRPDVRASGNTFWVMAGKASSKTNLGWLATQGITVPPEWVYEAPLYGSSVADQPLVARLKKVRPHHIVVTIGGGAQEGLGLYLKRNLDFTPAIHCIGAAIAFLSGDQVRIPRWADRLYLGWLFRCLASPRRYVPRYWSAVRLVPMMWRHRDCLPPNRLYNPPASLQFKR